MSSLHEEVIFTGLALGINRVKLFNRLIPISSLAHFSKLIS